MYMLNKTFRITLSGLLVFLLFCFTGHSNDERWFITGQNADLMLSGVNFNNTGGALMFNHPTGIASDGVRFLLCDRFNNRVLIWKTLPAKWDAQPNIVLGQRNFTNNKPGTSKSEFNWPGNVSVASNGRVAVADTYNDRILIWNQFPTQNGQSADISISLPSIPGPDPLHPWPWSWPWGVWTDGTRLVATATGGSAIFFWNSLTNADNQNPDYSIVLPQMVTPRNISTDGSTYFFVGDENPFNTGKAGTFFWNSFPRRANQPYDFFRDEWIKGVKLPTGQLAAGGLNDLFLWATMPTSAGQDPVLSLWNQYYLNGDGPDVVFAGGRLYVNNYNGNNVQVYNGIPTSSDQLPDFALSSPSIDINTLSMINFIMSPNVSSDGVSLFATSGFDGTVWIWKSLPQSSGLAPDVKILLNFGVVDHAVFGGKFVAGGGDKVAVWNSLPLNGEAPSYILSSNIGGFTLNDIKGVALDRLFFYIARADGALAIWQGIPQTGNEEPYVTITDLNTNLNLLHSDGTYLCAVSTFDAKVYIFRVADIELGGIIRPFKTLKNPVGSMWLNMPQSAITFNNSLAIANTGNNSVLLWKTLADAGDLNRVIVLGQPNLTSVKPAIGVNRLFWPTFLAAYQNLLWVGEFKFSSRLLQFSRELPLSSTRLFLSALTGGTTDPGPGIHTYSIGKVLTIRALPESLYEFLGWTGNMVTGYEKVNPLTLTLYSDTVLTARFLRKIFPPSNFSGIKVLNRSLSKAEYINVLTWAANPDNENVAKYCLFKIEGENQTLITELNPDILKYTQRGVQKDMTYVYMITAVNTEGRESAAASVTIH